MSRPGRVAFVLAAALALVLLLLLIHLRGPSPEPASAPPDHFSAVRAMSAFARTIGGSVPHPIGSAANHAIRDRIVAQFRELGYETEVHRRFACDGRGVCGTVENITARPAGQAGGAIVLATAHYDSVPAGPGASDDGTSVAALLEIARAVRSEQLRNPIMFLIDDGEEAGLLGAEAFARSQPVHFVAAVVNMEARGTSGPSYLFETSRHNRWFISRIAGALPRPATSSLFAAIYDLLPNDSDLTVYKRVGLTGVNFAFIGDVENYHTPNDDVRHVNLRSLQHQGDNALAALRTFANSDLTTPSTDDDVWLDVLGFFVVSWPAPASLPVAILSLVVAIVAGALLIRDGEAHLREIAAGVIAFVATFVAAIALGAVVGFVSSLRAGGMSWIAHPAPGIVAAWLAGMAAGVAVIGSFRRKVRSAALVAGVAIAWNALAITIAAIMPGASYLFLIPGVALSLVAIIRSMEIADEEAGLIIAAIVTAIAWLPFALSIYDALGQITLVAVAVVLALLATVFAPVIEPPSARAIAAACVLVIVLAATSALLPPVTADHPRRIPITYMNDGTRNQWVVRTTSGRMERVAQFSREVNRRLSPWNRSAFIFTAPAPNLSVPPVAVSKTAEGGRGNRVVTLHVAAQREVGRVALFFNTPDPVDSMRINGEPIPPLTRGRNFLAPGWHLASVRGAGVMDVEITTRGRAPIDAIATDTSFGLPPAGRALAAERNNSQAVTSDDGDVVVTMRRARF